MELFVIFEKTFNIHLPYIQHVWRGPDIICSLLSSILRLSPLVILLLLPAYPELLKLHIARHLMLVPFATMRFLTHVMI